MSSSPIANMTDDVATPITPADPSKPSSKFQILSLPEKFQRMVVEELDHLDKIVFACISKDMQQLVKSTNTTVYHYNVHMTEKRAEVCMKMNEFLKSKITFAIVPQSSEVFKETKDVFKGTVNGREILFCFNVESISLFGIFTIKIERFYIGLPVTVHNVMWLIDFLYDTIPSEKITWDLPICENKPVDLQLLYHLPLFRQKSDVSVYFKSVNFFYTFLNEVAPAKLTVMGDMPEDFEHENAFKAKELRYDDARWIRVDHLIWNLECEILTMDFCKLGCYHLNLFLRNWLHKGNETFRKLKMSLGYFKEFERDIVFQDLVFAGRKFLKDTYLLATRCEQNRKLQVISLVVYGWRNNIIIRTHPAEEFEKEVSILRMVYEKKELDTEILHNNVRLEIQEMEDGSEQRTENLEVLKAEKVELDEKLAELKRKLEENEVNLSKHGYYLI